MVSCEILAEALRDLTPEQAAQRLQALPGIHFKGVWWWLKRSFSARSVEVAYPTVSG